MLFYAYSDCFVYKGTYHIPVCLFLVTFIISCTFFGTRIPCLSSVVLHPSSHKAPDDISGDVFIFGKFWICVACLNRPGGWSVAMC